MGGSGEFVDNENKIMKKIAKAVFIDKMWINKKLNYFFVKNERETKRMGNTISSSALAAAAIEILEDVHERTAEETCHQINRLTNDMRDFPEAEAEYVKQTIRAQPLVSFYGYMRVPTQLTDADVVRTLSYNEPRDIHFDQVRMILQLDFIWYDNVGRHVMVWGKSRDLIKMAMTAIKMWVNIPADLPTRHEWMGQNWNKKE